MNKWLLVIVFLILIGGGAAVYMATRGYRNNNPFNLEKSGVAWNGKLPADKNTDSRFEQFDTMHNGLRAGFMNVKNHVVRDGQNTISKLINALSPPVSDTDPTDTNDTAAYIAAVSSRYGIGADDSIGFNDVYGIGIEIIKQENGVNVLPDSMLRAAYNSAVTGSA